MSSPDTCAYTLKPGGGGGTPGFENKVIFFLSIPAALVLIAVILAVVPRSL